jgi:ElaB/YqjD/DUF883 family membrane-anchored ribosome-binding protein
MANENEPEPEEIRKQMEETRTSLTEKLEALESQVAETVKTAAEAVSEATENVKETVETVTEGVKETVSTVAETFNLRAQVERRPWVVFGGSVALGCVLGYTLGGRRHHYAYERRWAQPSPPPMPEAETTTAAALASPALSAAPQPAPPPLPRAPRPEPGMFSWLGEQVSHLKGLAIGTLMGVLRDLAVHQLPEAVAPRVSEEIDAMTRKMGGEPIHGSLLPERESGGREEPHQGGDGKEGQMRPDNPAPEAGWQVHEETSGPRW